MAKNPKPNAEQRLKASAAGRRARMGPPFELSGPARRQLQDEAARKHAAAAPQERRRPAFFLGFWPRFAIGAAVLGVVFAVSITGLRHGQETNLAPKADFAEATKEKRGLAELSSATPAAAPSPASLDAARDKAMPREADAGALGKDFALADNTDARPSLALPVSPPTEAPLRQQADEASESTSTPRTEEAGPVLGRRYGLLPREQQSAANPPPKAESARAEDGIALARTDASAPSESLARGHEQSDRLEEKKSSLAAASAEAFGFDQAESSWTQGFARVNPTTRYRQNLNSPPPLPVLNEFQITRHENQVRVTDSDGSVYAGTVTGPPSNQIAGTFQFTAQGLNRAAGLPVTVTGEVSAPATLNYFAKPAAPLNEARQAVQSAVASNGPGQQAFSLADALLKVRAQVDVGGQTRFELIATPQTNSLPAQNQIGNGEPVSGKTPIQKTPIQE